ncbi:MAG TPA: N-6 DNA methylase [Vicinamibacterales bacterium]
MLTGIDGRLLSITFLERRLAVEGRVESVEPLRRHLVEWRAAAATLGPASPLRVQLQSSAVRFFAALGFEPPSSTQLAGTALAATLRANGRAISLIVAPWGEAFDPLWRIAVGEAGRRGARWSLIFDGLRLRIVDAGRVYARRHLEFDLDMVVDDPGCVLALLRTAGAGALGAIPASELSLDALVVASDQHALGVCQSLRQGVLSASRDVLAALVSRHPSRERTRRSRSAPGDNDGSFEQALTIVYRMLFLFFAEARSLVPLWHPIYRESYSLEALRDAAEQRQSRGLWATIRAIARLAHSGCRAGALRVTPFNGRLFAPSRTPLAERRGLDDEAARRAVMALSTRPAVDRAGRERIAYRDLGVEQLGAVYETLLDYQPRIDRRGVSLEGGSGIRKATGTFYTPQPIADYLVRRTLAPLVRDATPDAILRLRIVDPSMGSGAFLVAACRYLAHAYEAALVRTGACHASDIGETERVAMRRIVTERSLYGVDINPMAVQLARLSLWLATLAADRPLSFLDHRLQVGDSLLGAWIANLKRSPDTRTVRASAMNLPLFDEDAITAALQTVLPVRFSLESAPSNTIEDVREKERAHAGISHSDSALSRWKRVAHLWCAAWFADKAAPSSAFGALSDTILTGRPGLPAHVSAPYLAAADAIGESRRLFHWELEFPEVFFDESGQRRVNAGFDAVIGNPPWDMLRADAGGTEARNSARLDTAPVVRFTRDSGIYSAQSDGHSNRYQLFVERAIALTRSGGRVGLVLPSGLITDQGSAKLRRMLLSKCGLDAIVGLDNHHAIFPIHRSSRFVLLTASPGAPTVSVACRLGLEDPAELESIADEDTEPSADAPIRLTPAVIERISGQDLAVPYFRSAIDLRIFERAVALFPPLGSERGWGARFGRELNATDNRDQLRPGGAGLPVVEGKHLEPFRVALSSVRHRISVTDARRLLRDRHLHPRLAYRDVASSTNRLTLIAAVLPAQCASTHTVFCLRTPLPSRLQHLLCGLFNSFVVNYLVRMRVTTHVTTGIVEQMPIPMWDSAPRLTRRIATLSRALARRSRLEAQAMLNAHVAHLYQLDAAEFEHILQTFPLIPAGERTLAMNCFIREREG